jgi:hypothetical protein
MITDEPIIGEVIESYSYGENQVVTIHDLGMEMYHFFFLPKHPNINFGDTVLMSFHSEKYWVHHGNPHLTYRIFPLVFPGCLLLELISERMN